MKNAMKRLAAWGCSAVLLAGSLAQAQMPVQMPARTPVQEPAGSAAVPAAAPAAPAARSEAAPVRQTLGIDTLATIRQRGVMRVGVITVEPMVMRGANGDFTGYSIDLMQRLGQEMDVRVEFIETKSLFMIQELLDGRFDLLATGLWVTTERAMVINFTEATVSEGVYLVASRARAGRRLQRADYNQPGVRIAVFSNTAQEKLAQRVFPKAQVVRVDGNELLAITQGLADAALVPTLAPSSLLQRAPAQLFLPLGEQALSQTPAALGVRKGDPDFLNFLDTWLKLRRGEGWLDERAAHWARAAASR